MIKQYINASVLTVVVSFLIVVVVSPLTIVITVSFEKVTDTNESRGTMRVILAINFVLLLSYTISGSIVRDSSNLPLLVLDVCSVINRSFTSLQVMKMSAPIKGLISSELSFLLKNNYNVYIKLYFSHFTSEKHVPI